MKNKIPEPDISSSLLQYLRYGIQLSYLMINIYAGYSLVYNPGLSKWLFIGVIVLSGMFFCGWLCPFGAVQEHLRLIGRKMGLNFRIPAKIDKYLTWLRYFPGLILPGTVWGIINAQGTFYRTLLTGFILTLAVLFLVVILLLSLAIERPYCKYLCFYGASKSLFSFLRIFSIRRDPDNCISCRLCDKICPMNVTISKVRSVRDIRCINCMKCIAACPRKKALKFGFTIPKPADFKIFLPGKSKNKP